ncbi:transposase [Candidatus Protochlamydia naegleriophila]|uniref:Transposase n=1 Tax=Candidatus Protochlamydia naegleriophila TaxID=389348 RepID=A0A0U5JE68_9BACT|nr:transposase [Candidatus Protochlamydia naegleriophila]
MTITCRSCNALVIKKNCHIHNGKQNHQCLFCGRQFLLNPEKKSIPEEERAKIRQALLERVSLEGICRIFNVSMPWLLKFIDEIIHELPENLNANVIENEELEVATFELDEQWSVVGKKKNRQWLWLVFDSPTRQVLAMHVEKLDKANAECLLAKLSNDFKKKPSFIQISSLFIMKPFHGFNIDHLEKNQVKQATLKDINNTLR